MKTFKCPICKKKVDTKDNAFFPFCSERCRWIDLGAWLDGKYAIKDAELLPEENRESE
ncbi:MAG: DNA gyrase inhibitor YacG [Nitrospinales bacterium]